MLEIEQVRNADLVALRIQHAVPRSVPSHNVQDFPGDLKDLLISDELGQGKFPISSKTGVVPLANYLFMVSMSAGKCPDGGQKGFGPLVGLLARISHRNERDPVS